MTSDISSSKKTIPRNKGTEWKRSQNRQIDVSELKEMRRNRDPGIAPELGTTNQGGLNGNRNEKSRIRKSSIPSAVASY
jgi:hypothetical protein